MRIFPNFLQYGVNIWEKLLGLANISQYLINDLGRMSRPYPLPDRFSARSSPGIRLLFCNLAYQPKRSGNAVGTKSLKVVQSAGKLGSDRCIGRNCATIREPQGQEDSSK
jgi:hypothetical protein